MENFYCKVFINNSMTIEELAKKIGNFLNLKLDKFFSIDSKYFSLDVRKNKEFDVKKSKEFPDGFLYFPYYLDIDLSDETKQQPYKNMIEQLLLYLWSEKCKIVASSDFEDELPYKGGYNQSINY